MTTVILQMQDGDTIVTNSVARLKKSTNATVLKLTQIDKIGNLKRGDTLILLAHGNTSKLGGKTAAQIADLLAKAELKSGVTIDLVACNSGTGGSPLALEVKTQLVSGHKIVPGSVSGGKAYMAVLNDGQVVSRERIKNDKGEIIERRRLVDGKVKEQTPFGERTRNVQEEYRTT